MITDFNYYRQNETPDLILCAPDDTQLGQIVTAEKISLELCFNDISTLSYQLYASDDPTYNADVFDKHIERRQVFVENIGYFIITNVTDEEDSNGRSKQITAKSCEYELNNISAPPIDGTYCLYKPENFGRNLTNAQWVEINSESIHETSILYELLKVVPAWTLVQSNFVDRSVYNDLANTCRTFEDSDRTVYSFLINELSESYGCYVDFDIMNRTIRIYRAEDVFNELPMIISRSNILESCKVDTAIDDYVNCFSVSGETGVNIASCNPMGSPLIYNFDYDIESGLIDGELKAALEYWKAHLRNTVTITYKDFVSAAQAWLSSYGLVSKYKKTLLDAIGNISIVAGDGATQEEVEQATQSAIADAIADVCSDSLFLTGCGLSSSARASYIDDIENTASVSTDRIAAAIDNIFIDIYAKRYNLITAVTNVSGISNHNTAIGEVSKQILTLQDLKANVESEITNVLGNFEKGLTAQYNALDATVIEPGAENEAESTALNEEMAKVQGYITNVQTAKAAYESALSAIDTQINTYQESLNNTYNANSFQSSFFAYCQQTYGSASIYDDDNLARAEELYAMLTRYIKQQQYKDDTIIVTDSMTLDEKFKAEQDLYNMAVSLLETTSQPAYKVTINAEAFMFSDEFRNVLDSLTLRSALNIELPGEIVILFNLLKLNIDYDEKTCDFTLGNRMNMSDPYTVLQDIQKTSTSAATIVASERINWGVQSEKINELMLEKDADIDTTFRSMANSVSHTSLGSDGFRCYSTDIDGNETYGLWAANGTVIFTGGGDPKMAVGRIIKADGSTEYGFYGQSIIANTVTADKLVAGSVRRGTNYLQNGSFEADIIPETINDVTTHRLLSWDGTVTVGASDGYESDNSTDLMTNSGNNHAKFGNRYLRLKQGRYITQRIETLEADDYTFSFYSKGDSGSITVSIVGTNTTISSATVQAATSTDWQVNSVSFKTESELVNYTFKIENSSASNSTIYIDGVMLERGVIPNEYSPHISEHYARYTQIDENGITVNNGKIRILNNDGTAVLSGDTNGNLSLTGKIYANQGGELAGWDINADSISKEITGLSPSYTAISSSGSYAFAAGSSSSNLKFTVTHDGIISAVAGNISGWTIGVDRIYKIVGSGSSGTYTAICSDPTKGYAFAAGAPGTLVNGDVDNPSLKFKVTHDGVLHATNAHVSGQIIATSGKIAGFDITGESLTSTRTKLFAAGQSDAYQGQLQLFQTNPSDSSANVLQASAIGVNLKYSTGTIDMGNDNQQVANLVGTTFGELLLYNNKHNNGADASSNPENKQVHVALVAHEHPFIRLRHSENCLLEASSGGTSLNPYVFFKLNSTTHGRLSIDSSGNLTWNGNNISSQVSLPTDNVGNLFLDGVGIKFQTNTSPSVSNILYLNSSGQLCYGSEMKFSIKENTNSEAVTTIGCDQTFGLGAIRFKYGSGQNQHNALLYMNTDGSLHYQVDGVDTTIA